MQKYEFYSITATLLASYIDGLPCKEAKKKPASLIHVEMDWLAGFHLNNMLLCLFSYFRENFEEWSISFGSSALSSSSLLRSPCSMTMS